METETSTAALAVTVKPALNSTKVLAVTAAGVVLVGVTAGVVAWRRKKAKTVTSETVEHTTTNN